MTQAEWKEWFAQGVPGGWAALAPYIRAEPCDCGEDFCRGWVTASGREGDVADADRMD